ncbi:MAG: AAA family ATPase [Granulosicoccaceae bacterium]|jgi:type II secretory pathway predicted ATPase ExeA
MNASETNAAPHLARLGLEREPFADTPDESFFLLDGGRAQHLNTLYHLTQHGDALLLTTGCKGSGKTSLINKFLAMGNTTWRYCLVRANAMMNPEQLLRHVAEGFGLEPDSINFDNAIDLLRQRFVELHRSGLVAILIIDDAQDLPAASLTVLMKLSELRDAERGLLRILLFGEEQINNVLASAELGNMRQRISHTLEMPTLNEKQTIDYIEYRLGVAGAGETMPLSRGQMKKIYRHSKGIPIHINEQARAMLHGSADTATTDRRPRVLPITMGLLAMTGLLAYFMVGNVFEYPWQGRRTTTTAPLELPAPRTPVHVELDAQPDTVAAQRAPATGKPEPVATDNPESGPLATLPATRSATHQAGNSAINQYVEKEPANPPAGQSWLAGLNPGHFTLQLIVSRSRDTVEDLQREHKLGQQSAIITKQHDGGHWYVLLYGSYPDKGAARAAIKTLPRPLQQAKPWPRRIADLQTSP